MERKKTRMARRYRTKISSSVYAVQCQIAMALRAIANAFVTKNGEQELPPPTAPKAPELPRIATYDSGSSKPNTSEASKEQKNGIVSDIGENEVEESIEG